MITKETLLQALPKKYKRSVNDELLSQIENTLNDDNVGDIYKDHFLGYVSVLQDGKYKIKDYLNAVKYCTHKLMGNTNIDAYVKTFPERYQSYLKKGMPQKDIASIVSVYNRSKLVNAIMEQSLIPTWILNQDLYQKAINVQADLMMNANSEKVRSDAANSILNHLKAPETKKVALDIGIKDSKEIDAMRQTLVELSQKQQSLIAQNALSAQDVAISILAYDDE